MTSESECRWEYGCGYSRATTDTCPGAGGAELWNWSGVWCPYLRVGDPGGKELGIHFSTLASHSLSQSPFLVFEVYSLFPALKQSHCSGSPGWPCSHRNLPISTGTEGAYPSLGHRQDFLQFRLSWPGAPSHLALCSRSTMAWTLCFQFSALLHTTIGFSSDKSFKCCKYWHYF